MNALVISPDFSDETGLVRRLSAWMPQASSFERADAVNALARAYLYCELKPETRAHAEVALTLALDDEPRVRRALAEALAGAREAPRALVLALANDVSSVARTVLAQSPLLSDADLVDCVAMGDAQAQSAIARRARLAASVAAALAEVGERAAVMTMLGNSRAEIAAPALWRVFERFPGDAALRARLGERAALPAALGAAIAAAAAAESAAAQEYDPRRAERLARETREQAFIAIAAACEGAALTELAAWLRSSGNLTVGLLVRALACGEAALFAAALADMADLPLRRVSGLLADAHGNGFAALYRRAGMPAHFLPAFRIAAANAGAGLDYGRVKAMLRALEALQDQALAPIEAMLWRLAGEAARVDAREVAALALAAEAAFEPAPLALEESAPPVLMLNVEPGNENCAPPVVLEIELAAEPLAA